MKRSFKMSTEGSWRVLLIEKSISLREVSLLSVRVRRMLLGLMSRWMTPQECRKQRAVVSSLITSKMS